MHLLSQSAALQPCRRHGSRTNCSSAFGANQFELVQKRWRAVTRIGRGLLARFKDRRNTDTAVHKMALKMIALLLCLLAAVQGKSVSTSNGNTFHIYDSSADLLTRADASALCRRLNLSLASVNVDDLNELKAVVEQPCWISEWQGQASAMGRHCLAFYPGGAVAIPSEKCDNLLGVICQQQPGDL